MFSGYPLYPYCSVYEAKKPLIQTLKWSHTPGTILVTIIATDHTPMNRSRVYNMQ